jgi:hypothetical protein
MESGNIAVKSDQRPEIPAFEMLMAEKSKSLRRVQDHTLDAKLCDV